MRASVGSAFNLRRLVQAGRILGANDEVLFGDHGQEWSRITESIDGADLGREGVCMVERATVDCALCGAIAVTQHPPYTCRVSIGLAFVGEDSKRESMIFVCRPAALTPSGKTSGSKGRQP